MSDSGALCAARNTAPIPPRVVPMANTVMYIDDGLMPKSTLSDGLTRTARIIRPSLVHRITAATSRIATQVTMTEVTVRLVMWSGPTVTAETAGVGATGVGRMLL